MILCTVSLSFYFLPFSFTFLISDHITDNCIRLFFESYQFPSLFGSGRFLSSTLISFSNSLFLHTYTLVSVICICSRVLSTAVSCMVCTKSRALTFTPAQALIVEYKFVEPLREGMLIASLHINAFVVSYAILK